jgi:hypothetical protein
MHLKIRAGEGAAIARIKAVGQVDEEHYEEEWIHIQARIPQHHQAEFARYIINSENGQA